MFSCYFYNESLFKNLQNQSFFMSYKNYKWEVAANDYNSPYLRNWLWTHSFFKYPKLLGIPRAVLGVYSRNNQIEYLADFSTWRKSHEELKKKISTDYKFFELLIDKTIKCGEKLNKWTEKEIYEKDLRKIDEDKLVSLLVKFIDIQEDEYAYGTSMPILDFVGFSFIEGNVNRILKENLPEDKIKDYYAVFTFPENNSFAQDQEEDLLKLMSRYWSKNNWKNDIKIGTLEEIKNKYPKFYSDIKKHTEKYNWVYYVYMGPAFSETDFLGFIKDYLKKGIEPLIKLKELKENANANKDLKKKYIRQLKLNSFDSFILKMAGRVVWAKPRRKDYQSRSYFHVEKLLREISSRLSIDLERVRSAPIEMIKDAFSGKKINWRKVDEIRKSHACLPNDDGSISVLVGQDAEDFALNTVVREKKISFEVVKELKGTVACRGGATGIVRIINIPDDMEKMNYGNILVSTATTPSIVSAMKKASAIVTNEGGLTCHAAIVSRELGIPCIIGTKIATRVLKDGDLVEVDANTGVVKIIKKFNES